MKSLIKRKYHTLIAISAIVLLFFSCEYQEFADADYPDQLIYMPAALYNNFMIDAVSQKVGESPTPGYPERYKVDLQNNKFNVLLGAYRSGIYADGSFKIDVNANTDTISNLLEIDGALPVGTLLLPSDKYSLVSSVEMKNLERLAKFDLEVDLEFLLNNYPNGKFAIGIEISSAEREVNPDLATTIIVIDTKIMLPTAGFLVQVSGKTIKTKNNSENGVSYLWDFGDGETSSEKEPGHTYTNSGSYNITLTTIGITGEEDQAVYTKNVNIL